MVANPTSAGILVGLRLRGTTSAAERPGGKERCAMNLDYAVERLYDTGWIPTMGDEFDLLDDGRRYPTPQSVQRLFEGEGLQLVIKHNLMFNCYRATWAPAGEEVDSDHPADRTHGTVIGSSEHEAAVYALAQLRLARSQVRPLAMA
jgi:hypothetical protein